MPNALLNESSVYLRAHAHQPIDWRPWTEETLALARQQDKPILLSIGYSSCHWCHVMAHESFEDEAVAELLNTHFINIKVDREERPDMDKIYQLSHQLLTGRGGGWPLTLFLNPEDQTPFFAGTYFPLKPRYGMPAFSDLLEQVSQVFKSRRADLNAQGQRLVAALADQRTLPTTNTPLTEQPFPLADQWLSDRLDKTYGGFGGAPKFPHTEQLEYLWMRYSESYRTTEPNLQALYQLSLTLTRMAESGLFDQVGGGFFRYSVDEYWMIPHFEKMLYDNGLLLAIYAKSAWITGERLFLEITERCVAWLCREFRSPEGLFYSSQDADSEGHEGQFYVWQRDQVNTALPHQDAAIFNKRFGLDRMANFENSDWHLHAYVDRQQLADEFQVKLTDIDQSLSKSLKTLYNVRKTRVAPLIDTKIITGWNAMVIEGLVQASIALQNQEYLKIAHSALDQIDASYFVDNRLISVALSQGRVSFAFLEDVAYLLKASLSSLQREFRANDLERCLHLSHELLTHFRADDGGFWMNAHDAERLIDRPRSLHDEAIPSAAAIATQSLLRLGYLLNRSDLIQCAEEALTHLSTALMRHPAGLISWLSPLREILTPPQILVVRGPQSCLAHWRQLIDSYPHPHRLMLCLPDESTQSILTDKPTNGEGIVYCCLGFECHAPITDHQQLNQWLQQH